MTALDLVSWLRLTSVPRPADEAKPGELRRQIFASLAGAHAELLGSGAGQPSGTLAFCCLRPAGVRRLQYLVGGSPRFPPAGALGGAQDRSGREVPVLYPPGATGTPLGAAEVRADLDSLPVWTACPGAPDVLWVPEDDPPQAAARAALRAPFDDYVAHLPDAFGWIVLAEPLAVSSVDGERNRLMGRIPVLRQRENSEAHRIELERTQARYRELTKARTSGVWSVKVLVGGPGASCVRRTAALLCSASDLEDVPYVLTPGRHAGTLAECLDEDAATDDGRSPFIASSEFLASVARPPARELPGIRTVSPRVFDVTPEVTAGTAHVVLGSILDESGVPVDELRVPYDTLNRHAFICGATGSGKSQTSRNLLESLSTGPRPVPWLVVEPAKAEYARMAARLGPAGRVLTIRPGELDCPPASLNPLEPEAGFPLQSHADLVRALFLAAFEANEPFPQVLSEALLRCYTGAGWDLVTGELRPATKPRFADDEAEEPVRPRYPTLGELQAAAREVVDDIGYGKEVSADVRGFVDVRIGSLRSGTPGRFFEGGHPLDIGGLLRRNVVLELEPITNDQDKAFLMGAVLIRIVEHLRVRDQAGTTPGLGHVLLIEEAHRLLRNVADGPAAAAVELFASLLAEIRAYGEGVVVVEQIPAKIVPDVIKNTALKVMHRLPAKDDRDAVGATMNLDEIQSDAVVALSPGAAAVTVDGADRPFLVQVPLGESREAGGTRELTPPLTGRRSLLCGKDCLERACDLRELNEARALAQAPAVTLWTEAVAASLVLGIRPPHPREHVRGLWPAHVRSLDCALATVVGRAVDARRQYLRPWVDVDDFASRLRDTMLALLAGEIPRYDRGRWRAGYYRYLPEWLALCDAVDAVGTTAAAIAPPHPQTREWRRRGLILDGTTLGQQLAEIAQHPAFAPGSKRAVLGNTDRSGLKDALTQVAGSARGGSIERALRYVCGEPGLPPLLTTLPALIDGTEDD
jgi:DNA helicase HerA-like ATPase